MPHRDPLEPLSIREMFEELGADELKSLTALVQGRRVQARKAELIELLAHIMEDPHRFDRFTKVLTTSRRRRCAKPRTRKTVL